MFLCFGNQRMIPHSEFRTKEKDQILVTILKMSIIRDIYTTTNGDVQ